MILFYIGTLITLLNLVAWVVSARILNVINWSASIGIIIGLSMMGAFD